MPGVPPGGVAGRLRPGFCAVTGSLSYLLPRRSAEVTLTARPSRLQNRTSVLLSAQLQAAITDPWSLFRRAERLFGD